MLPGTSRSVVHSDADRLVEGEIDAPRLAAQRLAVHAHSSPSATWVPSTARAPLTVTRPARSTGRLAARARAGFGEVLVRRIATRFSRRALHGVAEPAEFGTSVVAVIALDLITPS